MYDALKEKFKKKGFNCKLFETELELKNVKIKVPALIINYPEDPSSQEFHYNSLNEKLTQRKPGLFVTGPSSTTVPTFSDDFLKKHEVIVCNLCFDASFPYLGGTFWDVVDLYEQFRAKLAEQDSHYSQILAFGHSIFSAKVLGWLQKYPDSLLGVNIVGGLLRFNRKLAQQLLKDHFTANFDLTLFPNSHKPTSDFKEEDKEYDPEDLKKTEPDDRFSHYDVNRDLVPAYTKYIPDLFWKMASWKIFQPLLQSLWVKNVYTPFTPVAWKMWKQDNTHIWDEIELHVPNFNKFYSLVEQEYLKGQELDFRNFVLNPPKPIFCHTGSFDSWTSPLHFTSDESWDLKNRVLPENLKGKIKNFDDFLQKFVQNDNLKINFKFRLYEEAAHWIQKEAPEKYSEINEEWLKDSILPQYNTITAENVKQTNTLII